MDGHPGTAVKWKLQTAAGKTGGNPEAGWRNTQAGDSDGAGSGGPASGDASSAETMGPDILQQQFWVPTGAIGSSGCRAGAAIYRGRLRLGGGYRSGEIL